VLQLRDSAGGLAPLCWQVSGPIHSYDARDQATIEAWQHDAATRREGVKHITRLCSEIATEATAAYESHRVQYTGPQLDRLLRMLHNIDEPYSTSDFAYLPLIETLEELMEARLLYEHKREVANILVGRGLVPHCPALNSHTSRTIR
jgi:hypothetical protein